MAVDRYGDEIEESAEERTPSTARAKRSRVGGGPRAPRMPVLETVPAYVRPSVCTGSSCGKEIFWIQRLSTAKKGKNVGKLVKVPVNCDVPGGQRPDGVVDGKGHNHHSDCVDAKRF